MDDTTIIILAGGKAERMGKICSDLPKCLLKIGDYPFLHWLLSMLFHHEFKVIISVGHQSKKIIDYCNNNFSFYKKLQLISENKPLGTSGAILNAAKYTNSRTIFALNADTIVKINFDKVLKYHFKHELPITMITSKRSVQNQSKIILDKINNVISFQESHEIESLNIKDSIKTSSSGCYCIDKNYILNYFRIVGSLENDVMPLSVNSGKVKSFGINSKIIDFGVPLRYEAICNNNDLMKRIYGAIKINN